MTLLRCALNHSLALLLLLTATSPAVAQYDEDADFPPGVLAEYVARGEAVSRIDPDIAFWWEHGTPEARLPDAPFSVNWTGQLLFRQDTSYTFHAYLVGEVEVRIDNQIVLNGKREEPGWVSGEALPLEFGFRSLNVFFRQTADQAGVKLYWSSDEFPLEPIPAHLLFRDEGREDLADAYEGRQLMAAHRCTRCHQDQLELDAPPAPDLTHIGVGTDRRRLLAKLTDVPAEGDKMPHFGLSRQDAVDVLTFLLEAAEPLKLPALKPPKGSKKNPPPDGRTVLHSVGCLACHQVDGLGADGPWSGGSLDAIGSKRTGDWLGEWLRAPGRLNRDHRMPVVPMDDQDRLALAAMLAAMTGDSQPAKSDIDLSAGDVNRGGRLVKQHRCAACHRIPTVEPPEEKLDPIRFERAELVDSCLQPQPQTSRHQPSYPQVDRIKVLAYLESASGQSSQPSQFEQGQELLVRRGCVNCHQRDHDRGIVPIAGRAAAKIDSLRGQAEALIPPTLTAVGDKLHDKSLAEAIRGKQPRRLPWLHVRMPHFEHTEEEQAALLAYLIGHDRIRDGAPQPEAAPADDENLPKSDETLLAGRTLLGPAGFSCIACHKLGEYEPKNTALGTRGSDLRMLGERMRQSFFDRWTRSPLRIQPGVEMPGYVQAKAAILHGDLDKQYAAMWIALNDPRLTAPTNPAQVEQYWTVEPGGEPRIIRDVFALPAESGKPGEIGETIALGLAIGFDNAHSVLLDLEAAGLRAWTFGEFAKQRAIGKSWYWSLAGSAVVDGFKSQPDLMLATGRAKEPLAPSMSNGRRARLVSYRTLDGSMEVSYSLSFDGVESEIVVTERWTPIHRTTESGIETGLDRELSAARLPQNARLVFQSPSTEPLLGDPEVTVHAESAEADDTILVSYRAALTPTPLIAPQPPDPPGLTGDVTTVPGFVGHRLPIPTGSMPTAFGWTPDGRMVFTSLKGSVYLVPPAVLEGQPESLVTVEEGLAAPFGVLVERAAPLTLLIGHKPELLRVTDLNADGSADERTVLAAGWGYSDNYHDWTTGPVSDFERNLYIALGSDYAQPGRAEETTRYRGRVLQITPTGEVNEFASGLRYPIGIATDSQGRVFVSDQQGVANTFNEINHVVRGKDYGVAGLYDPPDVEPADTTIQVPHPWTRSVNGIFFVPPLPKGHRLEPFAGHGLGCEYNGRFLIRFSFQDVDGQLQGGVYPFSRPAGDDANGAFLGPICGTVGPDGDIYVGSIHDSGWLGGQNTGEIVRLKTVSELPNGIRELRATADGFEIEFLRPVDPARAGDPANYTLSGYTRIWEGSYATPDSGRHTPEIDRAEVAANGKVVTLRIRGLRAGFVYELGCGRIADGLLFPDQGSYTLNRIPQMPTAK